jgi:hypothetical protein
MKSDTLREQQQTEPNEQEQQREHKQHGDKHRRKRFEHREGSGNSLLLTANMNMPHDDDVDYG